MYDVHIHKSAEKSLKKAPLRIREKAFTFIDHLRKSGTQQPPFPVQAMEGKFRKFKYLEAKIDKDYRIIFRRENQSYFIRFAGTHNELRTG